MSYINVGARHISSGENFSSKKAMTTELRNNPVNVTFYPTAMFGSQESIRGDEVPADVKLSVVGPDPDSDRRWYATVEKGSRGIKVS